MTAFARLEQQEECGNLSWELRSVNNRYLDISLKIPEELKAIEETLRTTLRKRVGRGKVECVVRYKPNSSGNNFEIDNNVLDQVISAIENVNNKLDYKIDSKTKIDPVSILNWNGIVKSVKSSPEESKVLHQLTISGLNSLVDDFLDSRANEGQSLKVLIEQRCSSATDIVSSVRKRIPEVISAIKDKLQSKAQELAVEFDSIRLEQELVLLAQKIDVDEELDRVDTHLAEVKKILNSGGQVGRKLDFLMQELNREANTLGSKSADIETTQASVELKVLIEQMREQIQNIE